MRSVDSTSHKDLGAINTIAVETRMLELFAPVNAHSSTSEFTHRIDNAPLWRSDAIHRANNLAQLTTSLANLAEDPLRRWLSADLIAQTRSLARVYEELGADRRQTEMVPCVPLLIEVATRLTLIFGRARNIAIIVDADTVWLVPDMRRALILMCSEMMINALKHAFPARNGGIIRVGLKNESGGMVLVVEDDGVGVVADHAQGQGNELLDRLGDVLGASVTRGAGDTGQGYRITTLIQPGIAPPLHA